MTKADLVQIVAQEAEFNFKDAEVVVNEIFQSMIEALQDGDEIELRGFGVFRHRQRNARKGRNPKTGKAVKIPAKRVTYFKAGKELRASLIEKVAAKGKATGKVRTKKVAAKGTAKAAAKRTKNQRAS